MVESAVLVNDCLDLFITKLQEECDLAEKMKSYINEYKRMKEYEKQIETLNFESEEYTKKIELARNLPRRNIKDSNYSS